MIDTHFTLPMNSYAALLFSRIIVLQHFHKEDKLIPVGDCNYQKCSQQYFHPICSCRSCPLHHKVKALSLPFTLAHLDGMC